MSNRSIIIKDINGNKCYPHTLKGNVFGLNNELQRIWQAIGVAEPTEIITLFTGADAPTSNPDTYENLKPGDFYYNTSNFSFWYCWVIVQETGYSYCGWMSLSGKESILELPLSDLFELPTSGVSGTSYVLQSTSNDIKLPCKIDITATVPMMSRFAIVNPGGEAWSCNNRSGNTVKTETKPGLTGQGGIIPHHRLTLEINASSITPEIIQNRFNDLKVSFTVTPEDLEEIAEDVETLKNQVSDILANKQDNLSFTNGVQKSNSNVVSAKIASDSSYEDNIIDPSNLSQGLYASPARFPYHIESLYMSRQTGRTKHTYFTPKEPILSLPYEHIYDKENKFSSLGTGWEIYTSTDAKVSCKSTILKGSDDYLSITPLERNFGTGDTWSIQLKKKISSLLQANKTYVVKMLVQGSDSTNCKLSCTGQGGVITTLSGNKQVISATFQGGYGDFYIGIGWTGVDKTITIYSFLVYEQVSENDLKLIYASDMRNAYDQYIQLGSGKDNIPEKVSQDNNAIRALDAEIREIRDKTHWIDVGLSTSDLYIPTQQGTNYSSSNLFDDAQNKYKKIRIKGLIKCSEYISDAISLWGVLGSWTAAKNLTVSVQSNSFRYVVFTIIYDFVDKNIFLSVTPCFISGGEFSYSPYAEENKTLNFEYAPLTNKEINFNIVAGSAGYIEEGYLYVHGIKW